MLHCVGHRIRKPVFRPKGLAYAAAEAVDGVADSTGVEREVQFLPPSTEGLTAPHLRDGYVVVEIPESEVCVAGEEPARSRGGTTASSPRFSLPGGPPS